MVECSCGGKMREMEGKMPDGVRYHYLRCGKCGEEVLGMKELHEVSKKYREMKRYSAKINKWGLSLGLRIPSDLVRKYKLKNKEELMIIPEKGGFKVMI